MTYPKVFSLSLLLLVCLSSTALCAQKTVQLPINLDYPLLQTLITAEGFPEEGNRATLVHEWGGCIYLSLAKPLISESDQTLRLVVDVYAHISTPLGEKCLRPVEWRGKLVLHQKPYFKPQSWSLHFKTVSMELTGIDWLPEQIRTILWDFIEPRAIAYFDKHFTINLAPPLADIKDFLLPLFPATVQGQGRGMLDSLRPGQISISKDHIQVNVLADVEEIFEPDRVTTKVHLTEEQLNRAVQLWENWDSMLTYLVTTLAGEVLSKEERTMLMDLLLDTRYRFVEGLSASKIDNDFVREQFIGAWQQLSPIFHRHFYRKNQSDTSRLFGYLAFVSSADALMILDRLGPTFGIEISRNGLIRMMQMLGADPGLLNYDSGTNPDLQKLFEMNLNPKQQSGVRPLLNSIFSLLNPMEAVAAELPSFSEIQKWLAPRTGMEEYIDRVETLLAVSVLKTEQKDLVPARWQKSFKEMILAIAWQESCLRQFVIRRKKLTYLLSYNKSSVGLMQVNERIWRGIYQRDRLRWDIRYNSDAGCEIAARYLTKYALKDSKAIAKLSQSELAGLLYAMYNGGPSQYKKYMGRLVNKKLYQSDQLFRKKFGYVRKQDTANLRKCLVGG